MTSLPAPICSGCAHLRPRGDDPAEPLRCEAYPDGIPTAILTSEADHREPYAGDHGVRFEPRTPADAAYARHVLNEA